ncbi:hypothetical protein OB919_16620 [Halobacteria archaeon AArc-curdl1]|uniref:DUF7974 domain-containing protein n=1 Tax=Natronosalvus hydrolyticus TaxID=2979988 RepID=A0AAP2ZCZ1_9EURY|nr:hypothetical protein [Halobacteria archaeon AArc-curdl1]
MSGRTLIRFDGDASSGRMRSGGPSERSEESDPAGMDEERRGYLTRSIRTLVPQWLVQRALSVSVTTERREYAVDDRIQITISLANRLPLPVTVVTDQQRIWGWSVDGELEASDEPRYAPGRPNSLELGALETKTFRCTWDGRFKRTGSPTRWVPADPGEYTVRGFVSTANGRIVDETTVRIR